MTGIHYFMFINGGLLSTVLQDENRKLDAYGQVLYHHKELNHQMTYHCLERTARRMAAVTAKPVHATDRSL